MVGERLPVEVECSILSFTEGVKMREQVYEAGPVGRTWKHGPSGIRYMRVFISGVME